MLCKTSDILFMEYQSNFVFNLCTPSKFFSYSTFLPNSYQEANYFYLTEKLLNSGYHVRGNPKVRDMIILYMAHIIRHIWVPCNYICFNNAKTNTHAKFS